MSAPGRSTDRAGYRVFGRTFDRLTVRLGVGVGILVLGPFALVLFALSQHYFDRTIEARRRAADLQGRILESALQHQMLHKDDSILPRILDEIGQEPEIQTAMILDHQGEVRISSRRELVGERFPRESETCVACHAKSPEDRERWIFLTQDGEEYLRSVLPIANRPACYDCHDPEERLNGILILDVSMNEVRAGLRQDLLWIVLGTSALALALLAGMRFLVRRLVLLRLDRLGRTVRSVAAGNLSDRARVEGDDVITALARDFNDMAQATSGLIAEVRDQESRLTSVMNSLDDGLVVLDREGRILAANRSFGRMLGAHPEALRGVPCGDVRRGARELPCCSSGDSCPASLCLATGRPQRASFRTLAEDGNAAIVEEVHASPVFDEHGDVAQVVELWRDITERVREEERLGEIERLFSLGTLASGFSHEVNTPLATMLTCAESVIGRIDDAGSSRSEADEPALSEIREQADTIREQVLRCKRITEQFLRFSRGIPPSTEPLDLAQVVRSVVALVAPTAREASVVIEVTDCAATPAVAANVEAVQHVVLSLLVNAIQSCQESGGRIVVDFQVNDEVRVLLRDTGCGIAPEDRRSLFEPFRSGKPRGTGLGLFLSRSFMRRFGGDVRLVDSTVGRGSCFEIVFARALEPAP